MTPTPQEHRRFARLPSRCRVFVRDRFGIWDAFTEDVSPRGCRIVTPRRQTVGTLVRLTVVAEMLVEPLLVSGQIVWVEDGPPARAGISFTGSPSDAPGAGAWVRSLEAAATGRDADASPTVHVIHAEDTLDIVVAPPEPQDASPDALARRLADRGEELVRAGQRAAGEVLLRRALALSPDDARILALLEGGAPPEPA